MNAIMIVYLGICFIFLLKWMITTSSVKKAVGVLNNQAKVSELINSLKDANTFNSFCSNAGISTNNLIIGVIIAISNSSGNGSEAQLITETFKVKYNKSSKLVMIMVAAYFTFAVFTLPFSAPPYILLISAVAVIVITVLVTISSEETLGLALKNIGEVYVRTLCNVEAMRYNNKIQLMNTISSKLDSQISYLKNCSNNTNNSNKSTEEMTRQLESVIVSLKKIYDFSVEESKKSPFDALANLDKSVDNFNEMIVSARREYNDNMKLYESSLDKINEIGKVEKSIFDMSKTTIESVEAFKTSYLSIAESIREVCESQLSEFVGDSKFTFSNLNATTAEVYEKIKDIFNEQVEVSNKMCQVATDGFEGISKTMASVHDATIKTLNDFNQTNKNTEKAIMAICAANYKLVDVLENDLSDANSSMKHFLTDSKFNLTDYFQSINTDLEALSKKIDAALAKKSKGEE